jgi:SSS family solute:Na+ symporter
VGRIFTALAACLSVGTAYIVLSYNNLMDYLQLVFSTLNAPIFAVFLLGMFTTWATPTASFYGLLCGVAIGVAHNVAIRLGAIQYGSEMMGNFYGAVFAWAASTAVTTIVSCFTARKPAEELVGITYFTQTGGRQRIASAVWTLAAAIMAVCVVLNIIFR